MLKGSCLCGRIAYELEGPVMAMNHCHCSICRKRTGGGFATTVHAALDGFRWVAGEELLAHYRTSPIVDSVFCRNCGSHMPVVQPHIVSVPAGTLDDDPQTTPDSHIFVGSKAPWDRLTDDLPQFAGMSEELMQRLFASAQGSSR